MKIESERFPGFPPEMRKNFWMYPRMMDNHWHGLSGSEQKVIDFILRRTWGYEKSFDYISISQFNRGGGKLGGGTGLSQRQVITAVKALEQIPALVTQLDSEASKNKANEAYVSFSKAQNSFSKGQPCHLVRSCLQARKTPFSLFFFILSIIKNTTIIL